MIVDFCVIPPLQATLDSFSNPKGPFARYTQLYEGQREAILDLGKNPAEGLLSLMNAAGVDVAVLPAEDAESTMGIKTPNEIVARFAARHPDRFVAMAAVDPHKGMKALKDLETAVTELGMKALCLEPWLHKLPSNHRYYFPIYAKCVELNIPVWIHSSTNFMPQTAMDWGKPIYLDEIAGFFPDLTLVAGHGGWPWVNEMVAVAWRHPNVIIDISAVKPKYLNRPGSGWEPLMTYGNGLLQDQVVFGSAWPMLAFSETVAGILDLPLKETVKKKWLGENAERILGISQPSVL